MNTNTGTIIPHEVYENLSEDQKQDHVEILRKNMTAKQSFNNQVSLHDHRSMLGKKLTGIRSHKRHNRKI